MNANTVKSELAPTRGELTLTRLFDAPRELVFRMWTDEDHMAQWWGPRHFTAPVCKLDARPGGAIYIVMRGPGFPDHVMSGVFREIVPRERLVFTNNALDMAGNRLLEGLTTVTFEDDSGKTRLTVHTVATGLVSFADRMLAGMEAGWSQSLDKLAEAIVNSGDFA